MSSAENEQLDPKVLGKRSILVNLLRNGNKLVREQVLMLHNLAVWLQILIIYTNLKNHYLRFKFQRAKPCPLILLLTSKLTKIPFRHLKLLPRTSLTESNLSLITYISIRMFTKRSYQISKIKSENPNAIFTAKKGQTVDVKLEITYQRKRHTKCKLKSSIRRI